MKASVWTTRVLRHLSVLLTLSATAPLLTGCGDDSSDSESGATESAAKAPYGPVSRDTIIQYTRQRADGTTINASSEVVGDKEIGGKSYWRARVGEFEGAAPSGMEAWLTLGKDSAVIAGGEFWSQKILPNPNGTEPSATVELDAPVTVNLAPPVGAPQPITTAGTVDILGQPITVEATGSYTLVEKDVSVSTEAGNIYGCSRFTFEGAVDNSEILTLIGADEASGEAWYHPQLGFVRAVLKVSGKDDYVFDFVGTNEMGKATSGVNHIQGMAVLDTLESFQLNTYDVHGQFDADKNTHAKMLVEARFLDEAKAKTSNEPPIVLEFGTVFGVFPHQMVSSPVSFFHPEENGQGFTYWYAYVDEAAKNEAENGIAYHVTATVPDYGSSSVRVTSRILYTLITP
jgi:hypothetical protein